MLYTSVLINARGRWDLSVLTLAGNGIPGWVFCLKTDPTEI